MAKKLQIEAIAVETGCNYPPPFDAPCLGSSWRRLGRAGGLTAFGVNLSRIPPGVWTSQRHWHSHEDEFVMVLEGELILATDAGDERLGPGDCAAFKAGDPDGHHLINRSDRDALLLEIGNSDPARDACVYSDIDMIAKPGVETYLRRDGSPYPLNKP
jgi:uncharacterized cupin superfamily protein